MRRPLIAVGVTCAAAIMIAGCAPEQPLGAVASAITTASDTVTFDRSATAFGDGFVAVRYPDEESTDLTFVVTDGVTSWDVQTNPACAGFAVTRADGEDLLVVLDSDASVQDGQLSSTTVATAFRTDGTIAWGPEPVPGALSDDGLITTEMLGGAMMTETSSTTALSPSTGATVHLPRSERAVHAAEGLLATQTPEGVVVRDAAVPSAPVLWRSSEVAPVGAIGPATVAEGHEVSVQSYLVLEWPTTHGPLSTVHRFIDGTILATLPGQPDARTLVTPTADIAIFTAAAAGSRTVTAVSAGHAQLWAEDLPAESLPVSVTTDEVWFTGPSGYLHRAITDDTFEPTERSGPLLALRSGFEVTHLDVPRLYDLRPSP